jgi:hypothetical protein
MKKVSVLWLVLIQWAIALEWALSGYGKFAKPDFMAGIGKALETFAAKTGYGFYESFLKAVAIPNAIVFGNAIRISEVLIAATLVIGGLIVLKKEHLHPLLTWALILALFGGVLMNLNFYFASGWSSPSATGINMIMGLTQAALGFYYISSLRNKEA